MSLTYKRERAKRRERERRRLLFLANILLVPCTIYHINRIPINDVKSNK